MTVTAQTSPAQAPARRRLPITLYVLSGVLLLKAVLLAGLIIGASYPTLRPFLTVAAISELIEALEEVPAAGVVGLLFSVLMVVSVFGLLTRRRFGWLLAMVLSGLFIALDIYGFMNGVANHLWQALNIVTVFYLNQRDVREVVGVAVDAGPVAAEDAP